MCCCYGVGQQLLPKSDPLRFTFLRSGRPENRPPPGFVSYRVRSGFGPVLRASLSDMVLERQAMSFYELLGIPRTGSLIEIKQAYKQLARKYHPDVSPPGRVEDYTERFIQVKEAYETLSDPRMRDLYDRHIAMGEHLAFTARRANSDQHMDDKGEWKNRWQSQLSGLKTRSLQKDSEDNMSWGARMRRERNE